jgi:flagellar hook-associated protein 3 FlgL
MRISERYKYDTASNRIEKAKEQNVRTLHELSSQKRINNLHDDPTGLSRTVKQKDRIADIESFQNNLNFSKGFINITENALTTVQEKLIRAQELTVAMANDTYGPESRSATAKEIGSVIDEMIQLGNTKFNSKYVFSGMRTDIPAFDSEGSYMGDDGEILIQADLGNYKRINLTGRELFEANDNERKLGHYNMIESLIFLKEGLEASDKDVIHKSLNELSYQIDKSSSLLASVGAVENSISDVEKRLAVMLDQEKETLSNTEDVDVFATTSDFKRTEAVLQSTLMASDKLLQPSLLNFMH